jgi:hypothetical protein
LKSLFRPFAFQVPGLKFNVELVNGKRFSSRQKARGTIQPAVRDAHTLVDESFGSATTSGVNGTFQQSATGCSPGKLLVQNREAL